MKEFPQFRDYVSVLKLSCLCQILPLNVSSLYVVLTFLLTETEHLDIFGKAINWYTLSTFAVHLEV